MALDPRTPVIVGVGQLLDAEGGREPTELMLDAVAAAAADAGVASLPARADLIAVVPVVSWRYHDPAAILARRLGAEPTDRWYPAVGGNTPQMLVGRAAAAIASGASEVALVCGGEAYRTRMRAKRKGGRPDWPSQPAEEQPTWGDAQSFDLGHPAELALGILLPTQCYPLFENALRHQAGRTASEHTSVIAELWSRFSEVAATNPYAVDRTVYSAGEIAAVTPQNRMIGFPYTKHMVANPDLDAASAVLVCAAGVARGLGIDADRWVFPQSATEGYDPRLSERPDFVSSAAIRHAGRAALRLAGVGPDDLDHVDLYSCFPSAVEIAAAELGIPLDRELTTYGGLCFAGGPWNNPVGHAIAATVARLRDDGDGTALVTANGGNIQKHAFGVYGCRPPDGGFRHHHDQAAIDAAAPRVPVVTDHEGPVTVETWTVMHERDGSPARAHAAVRTAAGARAWAVTDDPGVMARMEADDMVGVVAHRTAGGDLQL